MEPTTILFVAAVLALSFVLKSRISNGKPGSEDLDMPSEKIENDKIILIENAVCEDVKKAIQQFCDNYNQTVFVALPKLSVCSGNRFVVTFPYDIDFETFCYFVNYMYYPEVVHYYPLIKAWTTMRPNDQWVCKDIVNKSVMLYIPSDDKEYDNVYLTTSDNLGYKMGFTFEDECQRLQNPVQPYFAPINVDDVAVVDTIQFR